MLPLFGTVTTADELAGGVGMSDHEYDVVVVGGGIAGLTAACSAAEHGARVALLERATEAETGGNTRYTEAFLRMKSLDEAADGLEDTLVDDFMGHPDPGVVGRRGDAPGQPLAAAAGRTHASTRDYVAEPSPTAPATLPGWSGHGMRFDVAAHAVPHHLDHPDGAGRRRAGARGDAGQGRARVSAWSSTSRPRPGRWSRATRAP